MSTIEDDSAAPASAAVAPPSEQVERYAFHRLAHVRPRHRWWKPLLTGVVGVALYVVLLLLLVVPLVVVSVVVPSWGVEMQVLLTTTQYFDLDRPWLLVAMVLPLILMIPALLLASRIVEGRGIGLLSSVSGRLRMRWLGKSLLLAFGVFVVYFAVVLGWSAATGDGLVVDFSHRGLWVMLALVLLLIPLQAAAEEYVFRGYLMQLVGSWLRHPAFAILLPVPIFVLGHGYDVWGAASVGVFAIVAAWLSWRTGGLEAAISLHIVNNVLIFVLGSVQLVDANATSGTPVDLLASTLAMIVYALLADRWARRLGIARTATPVRAPVAVGPTSGGSHALARTLHG
ncbi:MULTISPECIES: CPBP family intramembrane glutamic endopeptidase [unclassified Microbacterium]|uniref:CPBP family intramembrane glutamic endopeptidase n=1 Tax=unclassified Microbacterium TaxID=2609290 RepID=UPI001604EB96|nr:MULTISPECIES: type II CAAX endopeptidase family protein [unclassified Microbacterium]QNA93203.1 CPBP family intramembrane metalloprotease [Microbacterium sp. Se63.02b]QYM63409.1 CPBP family intramembrane metalloprotease [Microbacterium sp. Se5.02b]